MKTFSVVGRLGSSSVLAGVQTENILDLCPPKVGAVITDENVSQLYRQFFPPAPVIILPPGEKSKTLARAGEVLERFSELELDRSSFVLGFGGGVVSDLAGFCASTYMRGISFGFVPTTLLAQIDAAIGGKNGVNLDRYKNMVGTFSQPDFVLCCSDFLKTLSRETLAEGLAECLKAGAISDLGLFHLMESQPEAILKLDPEVIKEVIQRSIAVKVEVVSEDEREGGRRRILNFGHTFGHALERSLGISHGEAVSLGMVVAARLSVRRGLLPETQARRLVEVLASLGLPIELNQDPQQVLEGLRRDKKRQGNEIDFVLLSSLGEARVERISLKELEEVAGDLC